MRENQLKRKLRNGEVVLGLFMNCSYPAFVEIAGLAGFDFAILDMEHGPLEVETAEDLCRAADAVGLAPIVRVRKNDAPQIQRALDIGSAGVQVPQVETREQAEAVVRAAKYAPIGQRGLSFFVRAAHYGTLGVTDWLNEQQMIVIHVEGVRGVENLDDILSVPHFDVIFLGPYDLSQSLGIPGQVSDKKVTDMMEKSAAKIRAAAKAVGTFAGDMDTAKKWISVGVQYVACGVDVGIFKQACERIVQGVRAA